MTISLSEIANIAELTTICQAAVDTLGAIDDWLGSASTREAATDSMWRLSRMLKQAGFEYAWRNALNWRGATMKELNDAGFFKNSEDGCFHYDPMADKQKPYRIFGNARGPTVAEYVEQHERAMAAFHRALDEIRNWNGGDNLADELMSSAQQSTQSTQPKPSEPSERG